ncbi:MAG: IS3 family transposase [Oscillospiraceae bacterium]
MPCSALSESGYYRWLRNRGRHSSRQLLAGKVKKILEEHPDNRNYGVDRVCLALEQDGVDVSRRTVYRVMKRMAGSIKDAFRTESRKPQQKRRSRKTF